MRRGRRGEGGEIRQSIFDTFTKAILATNNFKEIFKIILIIKLRTG